MSNFVALLTDFGIKDGSAACMEAVILDRNPEAHVIHISHSVPSWDISAAAMFLEVYYKYYPKHTVFTAVIDPGVGTQRKPIAVKIFDHFFVGPDNGIFTQVLKQNIVDEVVQLDNPEFWLQNISTTFHGRDIFAPVAARLAKTQDLTELGTKIHTKGLVTLDPFLVVDGDELITRVLYVDDFGNMVIGVKKQQLEKQFGSDKLLVRIRGSRITNQVKTFNDLPEKELGLIFGGDFGDYGTIAMNMGSAAEKIQTRIGDKVQIRTI